MSLGPPNRTCPVCENRNTREFQNVGGRLYHRCETCLATFLDPSQLPTPAQEKAEYDLHRNGLGDAGYRAFLDRLCRPLIQRLAPASQGLDYGCGPGPALAAMLREAGHEVSLWDPIYAPDSGVLDRQYDFITATEVVEHMHRPALEFRRIAGLLRPGGLFGIMTTFQTDDTRFAGWHYRRDPTHVVFYREQTFRWIGDRLGWKFDIPTQNAVIFTGKTEPGTLHHDR